MQRKIFVAVGLAVFVCAASVGFADVMDAARCKEAKAKTAGKKASDLLKAFGKNLKRPNPAKLASGISKADSKFMKGFSKAEAKSGCLTTGDSGEIGATVDAFVEDVIAQTSVPCDCCSTGLDLLSFTSTLADGNAGTMSRFACSNDVDASCADDNDCHFGSCYPEPVNLCSGRVSLDCTTDAECIGTCEDASSHPLPMDLERGGLYIGGYGTWAQQPQSLPDQSRFFTRVTACDPWTEELTLGPTTAAEVGERHCTTGRKCSISGASCVLDNDCPSTETCETLCFFGPPLPLVSAEDDLASALSSVCVINHVAEDASGSAECAGGESELSIPLRSVVYIGGDLFSYLEPPDIPGVQPCPICDTLCQGGSKDHFPCTDDSDCPGGTCGMSPQCLGGANNGNPCAPETSGSTELGDGFPTSHDCPPDPSLAITEEVGGLPIPLSLTTGSITVNARDSNGGVRNFIGFCRDVKGVGSLCFEGDPRASCPGGGGDGNLVPCADDGDCNDGDEYESCVQREPGAFGNATASRIEVSGLTDGQCLADGLLHPADFVSVFPVPQTFFVACGSWPPCVAPDYMFSLPGPALLVLSGEARLQ